jgi:hypothetical protein
MGSIDANAQLALGVALLGGQALTALGAAAGHDLLAVLGGHAGAISVTALAHESARLIGALQGTGSAPGGSVE